MLSYDVKTYERFFWMLYKDAFKQSVKGFFRADELRRDAYLNYFKYVHAYRVYYSEDSRRNSKWSDFIIKWVNTHTLSVWTSGLVFHYHKDEPQFTSTPKNDLSTIFTNEDERQALLVYLDAVRDYPFEEQALDRAIAAYEACTNDCQRSWVLASSRWIYRVSPADLYDELSILN